MADLCKVERIRADGFAQVLDFFYTSKLYITPSNVVDVLEAADFLQLRRVVKTCASILLQHIEHSNAPAIEILAQAHSCRGLASAAREHTLTNLRDVAARSVEFGRLSTSVRRSYVAEARHQFRLPDQPHAHHHPSTIRCVIAPSQEHVAAYDEHADDLSTLLSSRPTDVLVVVPAESGAADAKVLYLNPGPPAAWNVLTTLPFSRPRALYAVIAVDHSTLFVTGGEDCAEVLLRDDPQQYSVSKYDDVYAYSVADGDGAVWRQYSPMRARRSNHSAAESLGRVYVVGGHEFDVDPENEAEVFDPQTGQWTALPGRHGLHSGVTWSRCAAVALGDRIYVFGGSQRQHAETVVESNHLTYGGAQVFDIDNGEWEESPSLFSCLVKSKMKIGRGDALPWRGCIILIDEDTRGSWVQLYDPISHTIANLVPTHGQHRFGGYAIVDDVLYCTGGMGRGLKSHDLVHWISLRSLTPNQWNYTMPLPYASSHHTCLVVAKLLQPNDVAFKE